MAWSELSTNIQEEVQQEIERWVTSNPPRGEKWGVREWWERENYPEFEDVLIDLNRRGLLEAGRYFLLCSW